MKLFHKILPVFILAQFTVVGLFILTIAITIGRLADVNTVFSELTAESIPSINQTSKLTKEIEQLVTLSSRLTHATNDATRRIVKQSIDDAFLRLSDSVFAKQDSNEFLFTQLDVLKQELDELDELIKQYISTEQKVESITNSLLDYMTATLQNQQIMGSDNAQYANITNLYVNAARVAQQDRLHKLRQLEKSLNAEIIVARQVQKNQPNHQVIIDQVEQFLLGEEGLILNKVDALRLYGRARGRGNFVINLVEDIALSLQFRSDILINNINKEGANTSKRVYQQTQLAIASAIIVIVLSLFFVYYLYKRIVVRLIELTQQVKSGKVNLSLFATKNDDEIDSLGRTFARYLEKVKSQEQELLELSLSDPLTGIPNRRAFEQKLKDLAGQTRRNKWPVSLLILDIDYFKYYNDLHGHGRGDECLIAVANTLHQEFKRETDIFARYGGEEFIALLVNCDSDMAQQKAESMRSKVEAMAIPHGDSKVSKVITISIGVASYHYNENALLIPEQLIEAADSALYQAKAMGRNRCQFI